MFKKLLITIPIILVLIACEEATDENLTLATFKLQLGSSLAKSAGAQTTFPMVDESGTIFTIPEARVNVRHIQFDLPESSEADSSDKLSFDGPFLFNLTAGTITPDIASFTIEPGVYKRIDVRFDDSEALDGLIQAGDPLLDNTMLIKGTFDYDGNTARNFQLVLKFNEDLRFEAAGGIVVEAGQTTNMTLELDVNAWLVGLDITSCLDDGELTLDSNGDLIIHDDNPSDCQDIEGIIKDNIKNNYDLK